MFQKWEREMGKVLRKKAISCDLHLKMLTDSLIFRAKRDFGGDLVQLRLRPGK